MCPPGTDQTERGPQGFYLQAPVVKERCPGSAIGKVDDVFRTFNSWDAFGRLYRLTGGRRRNGSAAIPEALLPSATTSQSPLERLPGELIGLVLKDPALDDRDILAFGLASKSLWLHTLDRVRQVARQGSWAGTPLVCSGTYLTNIPAALTAHFPDLAGQEAEWRPRPGHSKGYPPTRRWHSGLLYTGKEVESQSRSKAWTGKFGEACVACDVDTRTTDRLRATLLRAVAIRPARGMLQTWFLRNLDVHQYVCLTRWFGEEDEDEVYVAGSPWLSLDAALLVRIVWTRLHFYETEERIGAIKQGAWAGHRFDVVDDETFIKLPDWQDVTAELVKDAEPWKKEILKADEDNKRE